MRWGKWISKQIYPCDKWLYITPSLNQVFWSAIEHAQVSSIFKKKKKARNRRKRYPQPSTPLTASSSSFHICSHISQNICLHCLYLSTPTQLSSQSNLDSALWFHQNRFSQIPNGLVLLHLIFFQPPSWLSCSSWYCWPCLPWNAFSPLSVTTL